MKGTLTKKINGTWVVRVQSTDQHPSPSVVEHGKEYLLHPDDHIDYVLDNNGYFYFHDGKEVEFEVVNVYVEPSDSIHCNRGDDIPHAKLINQVPDVRKMVEDDVEIKNMFDLPTAEEFLDNYRAKSFYDKSVNSYYIGAMLEFSKIHVQDAVRRTKETLYTEEQVREAMKCTVLSTKAKERVIQSLKQPKQ